MKLEHLDFDLPDRAVAQRPAERREDARLLVVDPESPVFEHRRMFEWPALVPEGALVVLNDTSVVRARLLGTKERSGGKAELLLVDRREPTEGPVEAWRAIGKGLRNLSGETLAFGEGKLTATVEKASDVVGLFDVVLRAREGTVGEAIAAHGHVPIPPYIRRAADRGDESRYQTVYARAPGAIAAPTAGLHLTRALLDEIERRGARVAFLTLHVGLGTFQPVAVDDLDQHPMHAEWMDVTPSLAAEIAAARARSAPVVAVGTTVVRALESAADPAHHGLVVAQRGETRILIQPGYAFRVVDALLTNFHLPRSTLLALVAAFAGRERVLAAYGEALTNGYRFYSYGDAMWIRSRAS
ncbi:MAG TPA: tRNA preQ1(34) S-adenosylmethionine ribosyltransferase-isomerase QueA [Polyangiaceae bacterium]|nr:tRNA preQ1(34) S-adenosylmethionine ribosyltransferase-isomerase QueA [Polyangiaceae bacterium]